MRKTIIAYIPEESPLYALHPATRLILFIITGFLPVFIDMPEVNLLFLGIIFALMGYARVSVAHLRIYLPMMVTVGLFIFLTYLFFPGYEPGYIQVGSVFGRPVYYQPLYWAFVSYVRIIALLFASIFYFSTNRERDILAGFRSLGLPFIASYFVGLTLRVAGMFIEDFRIIREAERARGLDLSALSLGQKVKLYTMYVVPLFSIALRRGDEIANALFTKGFSLTVGKGRADYILSKYRRTVLDTVLIAVLLLAFVITGGLRFTLNPFGIQHSPINLWMLARIG